ncbi:DNA methyltransferase [Succinivibrio dextrinosolvens]|uniref:DNA methyltransferase n=1 Tax=Succinivibrio dextrinosolvens TaxID=83771 RepID=UPI0024797DC6|nr:DNA methyltransferase [Succinivibrio dextrinosolvens]
MNLHQQQALHDFCEKWLNKIKNNEISKESSETSDTQTFWYTLIHNVFGVSEHNLQIEFEKKVSIDFTDKDGVKHTTQKRIDAYIPETKVLIEQKDSKKDLTKAILQSDGTSLTPFEQAKRYYDDGLGISEKGRYIVTCNFKEFRIYDMDKKTPEQVILLENLENEIYRLEFLVKSDATVMTKEEQLSYDAGTLIGEMYKHLLRIYKNSDDPSVAKDINKLCVRLAFCLYAEDAGLFASHQAFYKYLAGFSAKGLNNALEKLFKTLDTKYEERSANISEELDSFPYVNGGLFKESIEIPELDDEFRDLLLNQASAAFDWKDISPTIFGAIFESTLNPETRRSGGMHYTSLKNIHKVIDPLFLNDLRSEFERIKALKIENTRRQRFKEFQQKLGKLRFLDPACGSGNFLTETYLSLRKLENDVMREIYTVQVGDKKGYQTGLQFDDPDNSSSVAGNPIHVTLDQFYGIEINDYAVAVAQTAMWIAESQMKKQTERIIGQELEYLPLHPYENIHCANALKIDWNEIIPAEDLNYIMGNPPFIGASMMTAEQKKDAIDVFGPIKLSNSIDYVGAWYYKALELMDGKDISCSFVSTNSITQGEIVGAMWKPLYEKYPYLSIDFAYRSFIWDSETNKKAHVHCVIIGFSCNGRLKDKHIFNSDGNVLKVKNISPYLIESENVLIESRSTPICNVPKMTLGNKPSDGGNLILSVEEKADIIKREPKLENYIRQYIGSEEYINNKIRFCFWLENISPNIISESNELKRRVENVRQMRLQSTAKPTVLKAETPHLFFFISQPKDNYLLVPSTSSENRRYIPIGFLTPDVIASNACTIIPSATLFHFGILTSSLHNSWMRVVGGRLESRYRYSGNVVYNNFIWVDATDQQKERISQTAQAILDARDSHPECSLATLYDSKSMPDDLLRAHKANDKAVLSLYGLPADASEEEIVSHLMQLYKEKVDALNAASVSTEQKKRKANRKKSSSDEVVTQKTETNLLFTEESYNKEEVKPVEKTTEDAVSIVPEKMEKNSDKNKDEKKSEPRQLSIFEMLDEED